jgi:DNA-binding transcriptional regulator YdaS (Cro superfamily)
MEIQHKETAIARAVKIMGSQKKLADEIGVSQQTVSDYERRGYASLSKIWLIEHATKRQVTHDELLNDLFSAGAIMTIPKKNDKFLKKELKN